MNCIYWEETTSLADLPGYYAIMGLSSPQGINYWELPPEDSAPSFCDWFYASEHGDEKAEMSTLTHISGIAG